MSVPLNAVNKLRNIIDEILSPKVAPEKLYPLTEKYTYMIRNAGYKILMEKYGLKNESEILSCQELFSDYTIMFETAQLALLETDVFLRIRKGEVLPDILFTSSLDQLKPEVNKDIHEDIKIRMDIKIVEKTSEMYTCRCGCNKTIVESKQIARADEPPTVTARCIKCNSKWHVPI